jgi:transcriptional regulator with XRE-family HTH domain
MISPYVRRLRLGMELRTLRVDRNLNQDLLARRIGKSRMEISRLETGQSVDLADVLNILDALGVEGEQWTEIVSIAREACERGWWDSIKRIGDRQALYADLEAGAEIICGYEQTYLPGLYQIPEYTEALAAAEATLTPGSGNVDGFLAGRAGRQRNLRRPGSPSVEVIIDEAAVWRLAVPPQVAKKQIRHLVQVIEGQQPNVSIRVLKLSARIQDFTVPRCTFSVYRYPDPGDPTVVAIDTVTSDVIVTDDAQVTPYEKLYDRLRDAALSPADTASFLLKAACEIPEYF